MKYSDVIDYGLNSHGFYLSSTNHVNHHDFYSNVYKQTHY